MDRFLLYLQKGHRRSEEHTHLRRTTLVERVPHIDTTLILGTAPDANGMLHIFLSSRSKDSLV